MEYRLTFRNHLNALTDAIIFTVLTVVTVYLIGINMGFEIDLFYFFAIFYFVNISGNCYLHFQYNRANKHTIIIIKQEEKKIIYKTNVSSKTLNFDDIQKIGIHMMPSVYRGSNLQILPFEDYKYAVIYTTNEKLIITCLAMKNPMKVFSDLDLKFNKIKRIFPYIQ